MVEEGQLVVVVANIHHDLYGEGYENEDGLDGITIDDNISRRKENKVKGLVVNRCVCACLVKLFCSSVLTLIPCD